MKTESWIFKYNILLIAILYSTNSFCQKAEKKISTEEYINIYSDIAIREMLVYEIPASITLAQGLLESGTGNSSLAKKAKNHFGIKCHLEWDGPVYFLDDDKKNECFRVYDNPDESYRDHSLFLTERRYYVALFDLDMKDYRGWAYGLKKAGYATHPKYAQLLIKLIKENELFKYDMMYDSIMEAGGDNIAAFIKQEKEKEEEKKKIKAKRRNEVAIEVTEPEKEEQKPVSAKNISGDSENFKYIAIAGGNRKIYINNGIKYIKARVGDTDFKIANDIGIAAWEIKKYNELQREHTITAGQRLYISPKKKRGSVEFYIVKNGDNMHSISQLFGIKLKHLYKKNQLEIGTEPKTGLKLWLRKTKPTSL